MTISIITFSTMALCFCCVYAAIMLSGVMLGAIMLSVIMLSVIMLSAVMLIVMLIVVILSVVMLGVVAPYQSGDKSLTFRHNLVVGGINIL